MIETLKTNVGKYYDDLFGNRDGKFTVKDLPNHAILIVVLVVDLLMLVAEFRVGQVGYKLTNSYLLAFGFVGVSSLPFYLGQVAYLYNRANKRQLWIAGLMVCMGLFASGYYGFADYVVSANTAVDLNGMLIPLDESTLFAVAVCFAVLLVIGGLLYVLVDDEIANNLKIGRLKAKAEVAQRELALRRDVLASLRETRLQEEALKSQFPEDYQALDNAMRGQKNPTSGSGKK